MFVSTDYSCANLDCNIAKTSKRESLLLLLLLASFVYSLYGKVEKIHLLHVVMWTKLETDRLWRHLLVWLTNPDDCSLH